jgi:hypothetical protein
LHLPRHDKWLAESVKLVKALFRDDFFGFSTPSLTLRQTLGFTKQLAEAVKHTVD